MPESFRALVVAPSEALRILVVTALRHAAAAEGRDVDAVEAADGFVALARLGRESFDLLVADLDLHVLPADEFFRLLRARPEHAALPVVGIAAGDPGESGFSGEGAAVMSSPFSFETLGAALERAGFRFGRGR